MSIGSSVSAWLAIASFAFLAGSTACGGSGGGGTGDDDGDDVGDSDGDGDGDGDGDDGPCTGLECQQVDCPAGEDTTISGTVTIPSGTLPLYNAVVYVPNTTVEPFDDGVACYPCDAPLSGDAVVQTRTDTAGQFVLENVPVGDDIPLVIQVGKWRRQITVPTVAECTDTPLTDPDLTRLPRNQSEGDIPRIALTTGGADALECLLLKVGLDQEEFTPESGSGRVNFYHAEGGTPRYAMDWNGGVDFTEATTLWDTAANLSEYDIVLLSCEGVATEMQVNKSLAARQALQTYADMGGRVFGSHWHNYWVEEGFDPWPSAATFNHLDDLVGIVSDINTTFEKGQALAEWLENVGGSTTFGKLAITAAQHTVEAVDQATRWIYLDDTVHLNGMGDGTPSVQYLSFNTPMLADPEDQCGRLVLSDIHVSSGDLSSGGTRFPGGCTSTDLSPQEMALIFMLFDISSCIEPDIIVQ